MCRDDRIATDPDEVSGRDYDHAERVIGEWHEEYEGNLRALVDEGLPIQEGFNAWLCRLQAHVAEGVKDRDLLVDREDLACDTGDGQVDEYILDDLVGAYQELAEFITNWQSKTHNQRHFAALAR